MKNAFFVELLLKKANKLSNNDDRVLDKRELAEFSIYQVC